MTFVAAVRLSSAQREALDAAVLAAVRNGPGRRAGLLVRDPDIVAVLDTLPSGKSDMRYLDNALQRLRLAGTLVHTRGRWWPSKGRR